MIRVNFDMDGYVANWTMPPGDVENSVEYHGEVPEGFSENCRCYKLIDGKLVFDTDKQESFAKAQDAHTELAEFYEWFTWYDNQVMQYARAQRLGEDFDRDMAALDAEAAEKQLRIRELRGE